MKKVKLMEFSSEDKISKNGKPYTLAQAKFEGEDFIRSGFGNKAIKDWKPGMIVLVELFDEEYNGNMYKKFSVPSDVDLLKAAVKTLSARVDALEGKTNPSTDGEPLQNTEVPKDDLPF